MDVSSDTQRPQSFWKPFPLIYCLILIRDNEATRPKGLHPNKDIIPAPNIRTVDMDIYQDFNPDKNITSKILRVRRSDTVADSFAKAKFQMSRWIL